MSVVPHDPMVEMHWSRFHRNTNQASRDYLIVHYSPLVKFIAGRVGAGLPKSVDPADLVSYGVFGLMDAVDRFEAERGLKFETFAAPRIKGAIYDGLRRIDWVPRTVRSRSRQIEQSMNKLMQRHGRAATDAEIAEDLQIDEAELAKWLAAVAAAAIGPLDRAIEAGFEPASVESDGMQEPASALEASEMSESLRAHISELPERDRVVLSLYYDEALTLSEIGEVLGVTESRVSQIRAKGVLRLRSTLSAVGMI